MGEQAVALAKAVDYSSAGVLVSECGILHINMCLNNLQRDL